MIANFVLMGELYQHNPFDTEAAPWNTYPWHIGADNGLEYATSLQQFAMAKTIWRIDENPAAQGLAITGAALGDFSMFATLILLDQWGNLGSDVGNDPDPIPPEEISPTAISFNLLSAASEAALLIRDSNSEEADIQGYISAKSFSLTFVDSKEVLIVRDSNQEDAASQGFISATGFTLISATSTQV